MWRESPIEAFTVALGYAAGRAEAVVALVPDLTLPRPSLREIADAPAAPALREAFLARRGLARRVVARRLNRRADEIEIVSDESGAPRIAAPGAGLHLSLSGRGDLIAAAIADRPVGVDVEPVGAMFEAPLNVLHPAERDALAAMGAQAHDHLLRLWTAKEAYLKALGTGLAREPSDIEIQLGPPARIDGAVRVERRDDVVILDRGVRTPLAAAFVERLLYRSRPLVLACVVLAA